MRWRGIWTGASVAMVIPFLKSDEGRPAWPCRAAKIVEPRPGALALPTHRHVSGRANTVYAASCADRSRRRGRPIRSCLASLTGPVVPTATSASPVLLAYPAPLDDRDGPRDECGVFGIVAPGREVARLTYFALYALQHRGQESAGIATSQGGHIMAMRDQGLVNQVFDEQKLRALQGDMAVGHVRYSTTGANSWENSQPVCRADRREVALGHNGNLVNVVELHAGAAREGRHVPLHVRLARSSPRSSPRTRRRRSRTRWWTSSAASRAPTARS